jgi:hypothetical protein
MMHRCNIIKYFKALKNGLEATVYKSGNSISIHLPKVMPDIYHLNTNLKLPIETEQGGIRLKIVRKSSYNPSSSDSK